MKFSGIHHIGLFVSDPERSLKFYTEALGGKVVHSFPMQGSDKTIRLVDMGGDLIELIPRGTGLPEENAHWAHVALKTDDTRAAYELALKAGCPTRTAPQDVLLGSMAVCNAFVYGPDGEVVEFFQVK